MTAEKPDAAAEIAEAEAALGREPFGTHAPRGGAALALALAARAPRGFIGKQMRSLAVRTARGKSPGPRDVTLFGGEKARLHPADNLSERRAFAAAHLWDAVERDALARAAAASPDGFVYFLDVGANAGLYSLWMRAATRRAGKTLRALAVEPALEARRRMRVNIAASAAAREIHVVPAAATREPGVVRLVTDAANLGESRLAAAGGAAAAGRPLRDIVAEAAIVRLDAMKIDVEGHERDALAGLFEGEPAAPKPGLIVMETRHDEGGALAYCLSQGYEIAGSTKLNSVLRRVGAR